ncbi:MAG: hypothetical protein LWW78_01455 [Deltaproteobacteria bacterium]|nr:hypothetical protein [Deltaproteobacteria bacterium]
MQRKDSIRKAVWQKLYEEGISEDPFNRIPPFKGQNKAAERLRRLQIYKDAKRVMVPPDEVQKQVRLNILNDNKILIMATPGLRDGFYELNPRHIPIKRWTKAITTYGVTKWGRRLFTSYEEIGKIDLLIVTPTQVINIKTSIPRPQGIDWSHLNSKAIKRMRPLAELFRSIHT